MMNLFDYGDRQILLIHRFFSEVFKVQAFYYLKTSLPVIFLVTQRRDTLFRKSKPISERPYTPFCL